MPVELSAELVRVSDPPLSMVSVLESCSATFVVRSTKAKVLVAPVGAEIVILWMLRFVEGVPVSIVTVLVPAFVIKMELNVELGGWLLDQFAPVRQSPLAAFVQMSGPAAFASNAPIEIINRRTVDNLQARVQRFISARPA